MTGIKMNSKGFTLIELIVVMAVFLFIIGAAINIFISILQHQRRILAEQQILNQISYAEEYMSKALRMAKMAETDVEVEVDCLNGNAGFIYLLTRPDVGSGFFRGIKFINQSDNNACQEFFLDNEIAGDESTPLVLKQLKNSVDNDDAVPLTSTDLEIESMRFGINGKDGSLSRSCEDVEDVSKCGASEEDDFQPRVTVLLDVKTKSSAQGASIVIQTTVSQRNLNVK